MLGDEGRTDKETRISLTASLIVKNEERFLDGCLDSVKNLADEIVVVDTGSTDATKEIALRHGSRVFDFPWNGSFADARNEALGHSRGEWILYIDADERVRPCDAEILREQLTYSSVLGYRVQFHVRPGLTPFWEMRLFRNHPEIRFEGVIHENIWPALERFRAMHGGGFNDGCLIFDHLGYEGDQSRKWERNLPLLLESVRQNPAQVFHWCNVAEIYENLKQDDDARAAWEKGLEAARGKPFQTGSDYYPYLGLVKFGLTRGTDVTALLDEAQKLFPGNLLFYWYRSRFLMDRGRYAEAVPPLEMLVALGAGGRYDASAPYDMRLFGAFAFNALAICHFQLGDYARAQDYFGKAAELEPDNLEYRLKRGLCSRLLSPKVSS